MTTEMKSQPQQPGPSPEAADIDPKALAAIRNLIETDSKAALDPVAAPKAAAEKPQEPTASATPRRKVKPAMPDVAPQEPVARPQPRRTNPNPQKQAVKVGLIQRLKAKITGYRPTPRHLILGSLALLVLLRPGLVLAVLFFSIFVMIAIFLILGYDGFWRRAMGLGRWYASRRPNRAVELHRKIDAFAMKWDAILDRFPEGSVDGLYLPDFGDLATADKRHDEALDRRFANLREGEA
ncbi:MAG: hypothetical protein ABJL67_10685 [Sulfitobacter sp.]